jgi:hypothetical protein
MDKYPIPTFILGLTLLINPGRFGTNANQEGDESFVD